jgi:hypothetical protein
VNPGANFVEGHGGAPGEGVLRIAPGAAEIAHGEADEDARFSHPGGFSLDAEKYLVDVEDGWKLRAQNSSFPEFAGTTAAPFVWSFFMVGRAFESHI